MNQAVPHIQSRQDRDRVRQRAASNRAGMDRVAAIYRDFEQGRSPTECMRDIGRVLKGQRNGPR